MTISEKQYAAIEVLAKGGSTIDAAKVCGVHKTTVARWLKKSEFNEAFEKAKQKIFEQHEERIDGYKKALIFATDNALDCIREIQKIGMNEDTPNTLRLKALEIILNQAGKLVEMKNRPYGKGGEILFYGEHIEQKTTEPDNNINDDLKSLGFIELLDNKWCVPGKTNIYRQYEIVEEANSLIVRENYKKHTGKEYEYGEYLYDEYEDDEYEDEEYEDE